MYIGEETQSTRDVARAAPLDLAPEDFRAIGHELVDSIADFLVALPDKPVAPDTDPATLRRRIGPDALPEHGAEPANLLRETANLLFDHSTFNGHPRFWGYITSSAAPVGALAEMLAAAVNPNVGLWATGPMATVIEAQTVRWIAEMIGFPADGDGLMVSGGNMANLVPVAAARKAAANWDVRAEGMHGRSPLRIYASAETHTWLQTAADLLGMGTDAIRWVPTDASLRMEPRALPREIQSDIDAGVAPFLVIGTAGTVSTGAIDPLPELAEISREHGLWFHVDGAYGGLAAALPDPPPDLLGLREADSVAVDPHKWLYAPLEAGCVLVRDPRALTDAFSFRPAYYRFEEIGDDEPINYYEHGPQNSRGFRALKVWLGLRQAGRSGYAAMIADDIALAQMLHRCAEQHPELETLTQSLSITTFRYVPASLAHRSERAEHYLNELNETLLTRLQRSGEVYLSNAVIGGVFALRACIVNFRSTVRNIEALPGIVARHGAEVDNELRLADWKA